MLTGNVQLLDPEKARSPRLEVGPLAGFGGKVNSQRLWGLE